MSDSDSDPNSPTEPAHDPEFQATLSHLSLTAPQIPLLSDSQSHSGELLCFGQNVLGQTDVPQFIDPVSSVDAGYWHTCAILAYDLSLLCWGSDSNGETVIPQDLQYQVQSVNNHKVQEKESIIESKQTRPATELYSVKWLAISLGSYQTCGIILHTSSLRCFGYLPHTIHSYLSSLPTPPTLITQIATHTTHSCINTTSGNIHCWGENSFRQIDIPHHQSSEVEDIAVGMRETCMVQSGRGYVHCFGEFDQDVERQLGQEGFVFHDIKKEEGFKGELGGRDIGSIDNLDQGLQKNMRTVGTRIVISRKRKMNQEDTIINTDNENDPNSPDNVDIDQFNVDNQFSDYNNAIK